MKRVQDSCFLTDHGIGEFGHGTGVWEEEVAFAGRTVGPSSGRIDEGFMEDGARNTYCANNGWSSNQSRALTFPLTVYCYSRAITKHT